MWFNDERRGWEKLVVYLEYLCNGCARSLGGVLDSVSWLDSVVTKLGKISLENRKGRQQLVLITKYLFSIPVSAVLSTYLLSQQDHLLENMWLNVIHIFVHSYFLCCVPWKKERKNHWNGLLENLVVVIIQKKLGLS